jgi:hypothetical protein
LALWQGGRFAAFPVGTDAGEGRVFSLQEDRQARLDPILREQAGRSRINA